MSLDDNSNDDRESDDLVQILFLCKTHLFKLHIDNGIHDVVEGQPDDQGEDTEKTQQHQHSLPLPGEHHLHLAGIVKLVKAVMFLTFSLLSQVDRKTCTEPGIDRIERGVE